MMACYFMLPHKLASVSVVLLIQKTMLKLIAVEIYKLFMQSAMLHANHAWYQKNDDFLSFYAHTRTSVNQPTRHQKQLSYLSRTENSTCITLKPYLKAMHAISKFFSTSLLK